MLVDKIKIIIYKLVFFVRCFPRRFQRFIFFPSQIFKRSGDLHFWFLEWILLFTDIIGLPEFIEILHELFNWKLRSMSNQEDLLARKYFKNAIDLKNIRINNADFIFSKRMNIAFVSFYTINFHKGISAATFVHELVHIWQFENFGSPYIVRSLRAQFSKAGYDYGGVKSISLGGHENNRLLDYNYEQMAELVKDAYLYDISDKIERAPNPFQTFVDELQT